MLWFLCPQSLNFYEWVSLVVYDVLKRIENFSWTITSDGRDFNYKSMVGCSNRKNIKTKKPIHGQYCTDSDHKRNVVLDDTVKKVNKSGNYSLKLVTN